jgi:hypothetical protein
MRKELEQRLVERWPSWFKTEGLATDCKRDLLPSYRTFQR